VRIIMDLERDIRGKHVLLVEDIIDSGRTLHYICEVLRAREPASLKICTLLDKYERREVEVPLDYVGFHIPNEFVFGYGLDLDELYRNLPFIGVVRDSRAHEAEAKIRRWGGASGVNVWKITAEEIRLTLRLRRRGAPSARTGC
jgi:hypoxanthine phosphoribosyltransferase